jgi:hypothetical protein
MAAAAVEKSATFTRDTSNSSRNSQGIANQYFDIQPRVRPFRLKKFSLISKMKRI